MSTPVRIWFPGAIYHITARGNRKENLFREEDDYKYYLKLLEKTLEYYSEYEYKIISYCLMTNHVHILFKTEEKEAGDFISKLHSAYARYFNKKYNYTGHVFEKRYYSEIIKDDLQLLVASRYVHLNPIRAKLVKTPEEYLWSSYKMFIGKENEKIIFSEKILAYFKEEISRELYKEFVENF